MRGRGKEKVETEKTTKAKKTHLQQDHAIKTVSKPLHPHLPPSLAITCPAMHMHTAIQEKRFRLGKKTKQKHPPIFVSLLKKDFFFKPMYKKNSSKKGKKVHKQRQKEKN